MLRKFKRILSNFIPDLSSIPRTQLVLKYIRSSIASNYLINEGKFNTVLDISSEGYNITGAASNE